jgi:hypothetical protein
MHRNHPPVIVAEPPPTVRNQDFATLAKTSVDQIRDCHQDSPAGFLRTQHDPAGWIRHPLLTQGRRIAPAQSFTAPLNPRCPTLGVLILADSLPGQTSSRTTGPTPGQPTNRESHAPRDAPEPDSP